MDPLGPFARMTRTNLEVSTYVCTSRIWILDDCMPIFISEILHQNNVSERLWLEIHWALPAGVRIPSVSILAISFPRPLPFSFSVFLCPVVYTGTFFCVCQDNFTRQCHQRGTKQNKWNHEHHESMRPTYLGHKKACETISKFWTWVAWQTWKKSKRQEQCTQTLRMQWFDDSQTTKPMYLQHFGEQRIPERYLCISKHRWADKPLHA